MLEVDVNVDWSCATEKFVYVTDKSSNCRRL